MATQKETRKYRLHDLAHAYLRLALKTTNSRIKGALSEAGGYFFNHRYDSRYLHPVSLNNIYNVLAETLDEIQGTKRFTRSFSSASAMSTLDGYDYSDYGEKSPTMLNTFNVYGLITLYLFNKEILKNCSSYRFDEAVDIALDDLAEMRIFPLNPRKITLIDSLSAAKASTIIKNSEKFDKMLEKHKAELYLTLYYYNKMSDKSIFGDKVGIYDKFLDDKELTTKQIEVLYNLSIDDNSYTEQQMNYIITCNIENAPIEEVIKTPKIFEFNTKQVVKKNEPIEIVDMSLNDDIFSKSASLQDTLTPTYMYTNPYESDQQPLFLDNDGDYRLFDGSRYTGDVYELDKSQAKFVFRGTTEEATPIPTKPTAVDQIKEYLNGKQQQDIQNNEPIESSDDDFEPTRLVDKNGYQVDFIDGEYRLPNGDKCSSDIYEMRGDEIIGIYDQTEETNTSEDSPEYTSSIGDGR